MANTATLLCALLNAKANINFFTQQQLYWSGKYEANSAKLNKMTKYAEKWESAFDSAIDNTKELTAGSVKVCANNKNELIADAYADAKVKEYDEDVLYDLEVSDEEFDAMQTMFEAMLEEARAKKDGLETAVQTAAQDTGTNK